METQLELSNGWVYKGTAEPEDLVPSVEEDKDDAAASGSSSGVSFPAPVPHVKAVPIGSSDPHVAHGFGTLHDASGRTLAEGTWESGWFSGGGKTFFMPADAHPESDPEMVSEGEFKKGVLSEGWRLDETLEKKLEGSFDRKGILQGPRAKLSYVRGPKLGDEIEGEVLNGELCGRVMYKYATGELYEGLMMGGQRNGYGKQHQNTGELLGAGLWVNDQLTSTEPVPTACLLQGKNVPQNIFSVATLLYQNGCYYKGAVAERKGKIIPHGEAPNNEGFIHAPNGAVLLRARWKDGQVVERLAGPIDRITPGTDEIYAARDGFYVGQLTSATLVQSYQALAALGMGMQIAGAASASASNPALARATTRVPHGVCRRYGITGEAESEGRFVAGKLVNGWHLNKAGLYDGEWADGTRNGFGKYTYLEGMHKGDIYEGEWRRNIRVGLGVRTAANGEVYDGQWNGNLKKGWGIEWSRMGKVKHMGMWNNLFTQPEQPVPRAAIIGKKFLPPMVQSASLIYPNLNFFVGPLETAPLGHRAALGKEGGNMVPHGVGKMYNAQGLLLAEGNWDMGQQVSGAQTSAQDLARAAASMPAQSPATSSSAASRDDGPSASEFEAPVVIPEFSAEEEARMERRAEMHERFDNLMAKTASKLAQGGTVTPATTVVSPTHVAQSARVVSAAQSLAEKKAALAQRQAQLARVHQAQQGPVTLGAPMYGQPQYVQPQPVMMAPPVPQPVVMAPPPPPGVQIPQFSTVKQLMDALNYLLSNNRNVIARIETALFSMYGAANAQYMYHGAWCCAALSAKPSLVAALLHRTQPLDPRQMLQMFPPGCRIDPDPPVAMQQQQQPMQLQQAQMQMQQPQILQPQQQPLQQQQQQQQQPLSPHPPGGPQSPLSSQQSQPAFAQPQPVHHPQPQIVSAPPQAVHSPPPPVAAAPSPVPASAPAVVSPRTVAPVTPAPAVHAPIVAAAAGPGQKLHGGFVKKKSHSNRHNWNKRTLELYQRQLQYNDPAAPASHPKSKWTILPLSKVSDCSVAKKGVGKGSDKGVRFNLLLKDKRAYEFITELAAEAQGWNNRINQAMIDLKTLPPQSAAVQPLHVSSSSALASKEEPADKSILPSVPTITAISDSKTDKFVSQVASNGKKIEKAHEQVLSASENISKVAEAFSSNSSEIAKHSALGAEIIGHVGSVAQGLSSMVSKVFPPFAIVFDLITLITKKASEAKTNQSNCRYLADRCEALRGVLMSVRDHWATVEARSQATPPTPESQLALTQLQAVLPLFQKVVDELQNAADLLSEYSGMSTFRKFVSSASIQSRFEECDANISKVVADLTFGLSADAATKAGEVLQNLQSSMPYLSEKVDQVLSEMMSGNEAANARDERIQQRLEQLKADHTDVSSALASSRGHLASMKRLGLKQQAQTDAANKRVEEMASMLQQLLLAQQQSQAARANDPVSSTASTASSSSVATSSTGATSPQSSVSDSSSSSNSSSGHSSSHSSFNFNSAFEIAPDEIELESEAGRGSFGVVYRARYRGQRVAVKKLLLTSEVSAEELRSEFQREVQALCSIRHNRLILAYGACTSVEDPFIVTEWLERGSLFDCIHPSPAILAKGGDHNRPPRSALLPLCVQILEGITYLHMSRPPVIHRDIKTANVLIDENFNARISDFGFAKSFGTGSQASIMSSGQSNAGTVAYQAPELLTMTSSATPASDMYAVGVLLFEIFTGDVPWKGKQLFEIVMLVGVQQKSLMQCNDQATIDKIPAGIQAIITALFREASLRPNASEVLQMLLKEVAREKSAASASSK